MKRRKNLRIVPSTIYDKQYYLHINDGGALGRQDNKLSPRLAYMAKLADIGREDVVLDVGCGTGELAFHCAARGAKVYAIDYSKDAIKMCLSKRKKMPKRIRERTTFIHGSVTTIDKTNIPGGTINKVLMTDIVEHLYPEQLEEALARIRQLVHDNAKLFVHTAPNLHFYSYGYPIIRWSYPVLRHIGFVKALIDTKPNWKGRTSLPKDPEEGSHNKQGHVNEQTPQTLNKMLRKTGYKYRTWTLPFLRDVHGMKISIIYALLRIPPLNLMFCSEIVSIAQKEGRDRV
jgi:SAM-dependent methyltransferase